MGYYKQSASVLFDRKPRSKGDFQVKTMIQTEAEYRKVHKAIRATSAANKRESSWTSRSSQAHDVRTLEATFARTWRKIGHHPQLSILTIDDDKLRRRAKQWLKLGFNMSFTRAGKPLPVIDVMASRNTNLVLAFCMNTFGAPSLTILFNFDLSWVRVLQLLCSSWYHIRENRVGERRVDADERVQCDVAVPAARTFQGRRRGHGSGLQESKVPLPRAWFQRCVNHAKGRRWSLCDRIYHS